MEKRNVVAIFAHPDDETFGPGGTLALLAQTHNVYIICATKGEAGQNYHENDTACLSDIREQELQKATQILGVKEVIFLDFLDATLCNKLYHKLANEITNQLEQLRPEIVITFEPRGLSGHIDHITVTMATTFVFEKLPFIKKLMYFCLSEEKRTEIGDDYFIYFPPGYKHSEIDEVVDVSSVWNKRMEALRKHESQKKDIDEIMPCLEKFAKEEHFLVKER